MIIFLFDGCFFTVGATNDYGAGWYDILLAKLDFVNNYLLVKNGAGVLIKQGGKIK